MEDKDYLYYFWQNSKEDWIREFAPLWKDKTLIGLTVQGGNWWRLWTQLNVIFTVQVVDIINLMKSIVPMG